MGTTRVEFAVEGPVSTSVRSRQLSAAFDVPPQEKCRIEWSLDLDLDTPWQIGLVVGPSGSGKTSVMRHLWGEPPELDWSGDGVIDAFGKGISIERISAACQAVGFNTIPAWMRPFSVLSNGEKFRVDLARRLLEGGDPVVVDEFTSVVDRQVAKIGSHAVQKFVRRNEGQRFVAVGCHYDVIDWLQPDWILDMATRQFTRRLLQRRPPIDVVVARVPRTAWPLFAPFHYLSASLHKAAQCYGLWADGELAAFAALLPFPVSQGPEKGSVIWRVSRVVTLPDYQGVGLAFVLLDALGGEHRARKKRLRMYPAHASLTRAFDRSPSWRMVKEPGFPTNKDGRYEAERRASGKLRGSGNGMRPCAVFEYTGPAVDDPVLISA